MPSGKCCKSAPQTHTPQDLVNSELPPVKEQSTNNVPPPIPLSFVDQTMLNAYIDKWIFANIHH